MQAVLHSHRNEQGNLFQSGFTDLLDQDHPLYKLSHQIDWSVFERRMGKYFSEDQGRPSLSIRLMVGLHYLKSIYKESDESVVSKFKENAYWQYFCGFEYFQYSDPCNATSLVHWRKRFGREGVELLLKETLGVTRRSGELGRRDLRRG